MEGVMFIENKYTKWYFQIIEKARQTTYSGYTETHHIIPKSLGGSNSFDNLIKLSAREHFVCHLLLTKMVAADKKAKMFYSLSMMKTANQYHRRDFKINSKIFETIKINLSKAMKEKWTDELRAKKSKEMTGKNNHFYGKTHSKDTIEKLKNKHVSENTKKLISLNQKERFKNQPGTFLGKTHSIETREKMSISASKPKSKLWKESASKNRKGKIPPNKGIPHSEETKKKISQAMLGEKNSFFGKTHSPEQREKKRQEKLAAPKKICYYCSKEVDPMNYSRWHGDNCKSKK